MKIILILCLAGLAFASRSGRGNEWYWESGKEYVYQYHGRLLTGIPELADVYSGIGINATVHIRSASNEENTYFMVVRNPKFVRVNDKLQPINHEGNTNWRELGLPEVQEVSSEYRTYLEQPIMFTFTNGEITSAKFSKNEPVWSVNFKKALALQFQTKQSVGLADLQNDLQNQVQEEESSSGEPTYWKVKEETIDGVCENVYEVRQIPKYMVVDRPEMIPFPEACPEQKYFGVTKTKDVAKCEKNSGFNYFGTGRYGYQLTGNNMNMWGRSSSTRYIACGSRGRLVIQTIINDGELNQNLLGYKTERFVTGTMQVFHLKEVTSHSTNWDLVGETVTVKSMMFEHSRESFEYSHVSNLKNLSPEEELKASKEGRIPRHLMSNPNVVRQALPRNYLYGLNRPEDVPEGEMKTQIKRYISEIVRGLLKGVDTKSQYLTSKVTAVSRGFSMLKGQEEIKSVYEELKSEFSGNQEDLVSMKNVFFDTLLTSGTPEALHFLKKMILADEFTTVQVATFFTWMPTYIRMPSEELLHSIYELVTNEKIRQNRFFYNKAIMGFSTLLQKACISSYRRTMYPINVFGEFCNPESEIVVSKWIPYLAKELKTTESYERRNEVIVSLGIMQHKSIIGELIPFIEGTFKETTKLNRYLAIHSLASAADRKDPTHVIPIFFSILSNPAESTTLRIASFNALMKLNPSMAVMHKIAALTWTIRDEEVLKVINIAFFTLSKETGLEMNDETTLTLPKKAFLVFPLIKKTPGILPSSATVYMSDRLPELGVGYNSKTSWIASNSSFIPKDLYTEVTYFLDQYRFTPFSFGVRLSGAENLYQQVAKLLKPIEQQLDEKSNQEETLFENEDLNQDWEKIMKELKLKTRENGPMDGAFFLRWFESSPLFYNFDKLSRHQLQKKIASVLSDSSMVKEKICGKFPLNFQQTLIRAPSVFMVPSDLGFPIVIENHMPVAFSVRGFLDVNCESSIPSVTYDATIVSDSQYSAWVGTIIPFTKEYVVTGVQEKFTMNLPARIEAKFDIPSSKIAFNFRLDTSSVSSPMDLIYYHVKPYITYKKITDLTPLFLTSELKHIHSNTEVKKVEYPIFEYLGLGLKNRAETESPYIDLKACMTVWRMYNYNPLNMLRFSWTSPALDEREKPSLRSHEQALVIDPTSSALKEMKFEVKIGAGQKVRGEQTIKYHTVQLNRNNNHESRGNNQRQQQQLKNILLKLSPFQLQTNDIEHEQVHPRRQHNIKQALQKLNVESGYAVTIAYTLSFMGSRPRTLSNVITFAAGKESHSGSHGITKSKWNVEWETESSSSTVRKVCIKGSVDMPILPIWNIEELRSSLVNFHYDTAIGFGSSSCSESSINVVGNAKVSHEQKEHSRQSEQARHCQKQMEENVPGAKLSEACEQTRLQAQTVDEVEFKTTYNNVPEAVYKYEARFTEYLKMFLWPYIKAAKSSSSLEQKLQSNSGNYATLARVLFHRETPSFDLILNRQSETISFSKIRIPYPLNLVFPLKAGRNNAYLAVKAITGGSFTPECKVGVEKLVTFDNSSLPLEIDDCFHLLSGDCSRDRSFGILVRNMKPSKTRRELKVFLGKIALVFTPSESRNEPYFADIRVTVDHEELTLPANTWRSIKQHNQKYGELFRSSDNVFQLRSEEYNAHFLFDGTKVVIYASNLLKNKLCGLCGNFNQLSRDDMIGPAKCFHANPETFTASYRVQSNSCQSLQKKIERNLEQDRERCIQYKEIPTQVAPSLKAQAGKCIVKRHIVIQRQNEVCISKAPAMECRTACIAPKGQMIFKKTPFICIPQGRLADLYVKKASDGQEIKELRSMETSFESKVEQPKRCVSAFLQEQN